MIATITFPLVVCFAVGQTFPQPPITIQASPFCTSGPGKREPSPTCVALTAVPATAFGYSAVRGFAISKVPLKRKIEGIAQPPPPQSLCLNWSLVLKAQSNFIQDIFIYLQNKL